ncbi:HutD family protein [Noviherbaspirillum saxi]|uniref:HutD family protein n=1 Tax=Noviherbaspirillum saxi TaxID=2320863 RepID=A0A3A3FU87_9BURK|nr:HutD family protein [Noviherbaspirillum saxi]RJF99353.1 HutD family protein [Noviherbaspirillum saxi]
MQKFTPEQFVTMPWKNGGGSSTQIAVYPPGANHSGFEWRISTARVESAGPFSLFAGFDRSLAIVEGNGIALAIDSLHATILSADTRPFAFRGEQQVHASLLDGPVVDLNIFTRRSSWTHTLEKLEFSGTLQCGMQADLIFIYNARGAGVHCRTLAGRELDCGSGEAVLIDSSDGDHVALSAPTTATLYIARLTEKHHADNQ